MNKQQAAASQIRTLPIIISFITAGFIGLFSETALNMALRSLTLDFGIEATTAQWLTTGYLLTLGILVPISGLILQWFTTRQLFMTSLVFSIIGTFIAAVAPVFSILMVARVVQAVGTALLLPLMFNTILVIIPPHKRGRSMGIIGLVIMFAPAVGPTVSGLILKSLTWHWIFWISLPLLMLHSSLVISLCKILQNQQDRKSTSYQLCFQPLVSAELCMALVVPVKAAAGAVCMSSLQL